MALASPAAGAGTAPSLHFRDQAAETGAASRFLRAYGIVTSTFRTVAHNRAVGGVPNSYHLLDQAIDLVRRPGVSHQQIDAALRKAGYSLIESLDEPDHSHFAFAPARITRPAVQNTPEAPPAPPPPRLAADIHGTLNMDLQAQAARGSEPRSLSR